MNVVHRDIFKISVKSIKSSVQALVVKKRNNPDKKLNKTKTNINLKSRFQFMYRFHFIYKLIHIGKVRRSNNTLKISTVIWLR